MQTAAERVYWTEEEKEKLINGVVRLRLNEPRPTLLVLLNRVQNGILPPDRTRTVQTVESLPWLEKGVKARLREILEKASGATAAPPPPAPPPAPTITREQVLRETTTLELVQHLLIRLSDNIEDLKAFGLQAVATLGGVVAAAKGTTNIPAPTQPQELPRIASKMKRVLVVGVFPKEMRQLEAAVGSRVELRFVEHDDMTNKAIPHADLAYVMMNNVNAGIKDKVVARLGKENVRIHVGGIGELTAKIREL